MHIVHKNRPGQPYKTIGQLSEEEIAVLKRHRKGDTRPEVSERIARQAGEIIQRIKRQQAWIACDCLGANHLSPPILTPRETPTGKYTLQREGGRTEHGANCLFRWEEGELTGHQERTQGMHTPLTHETPDFILYKRNDATAITPSGSDKETHGKDRTARLDPLARRLYCLIEAAGLNRMTGPIESLKDQLAAIRSEAKEILLFHGKEYTLADILWTNIDWLYKGWARHHLLKMEKDTWPSNTPLQGYLLLYVDSIEGQVIHTPHGSLTVTGSLKKLATDAMESRAPYVCLVSLQLSKNKERLDIHKAYAHPVNRHTLFPVESDVERDAAGVLAWVADKARGEGRHLEIEKPLYDIVANGQGESCRPDFLVRDGNRVLVIETMGSHQESYRQRKERTHKLMEQIGTLILDERAGVEPKTAGRILAARVFEWLRSP